MNKNKDYSNEDPFGNSNPAGGYEYNKQGENAKSAESYNDAIKTNPNDALAFLSRANSHFEEGKYQEAVKDYDEALRLFQQELANGNSQNMQKEISQIYVKRGAARMKLGDIDGGMEDLQEAHRRSPDTVHVQVQTSVQIKKHPDNKWFFQAIFLKH